MLIGNLGADAETRHTASGIPVTSFRLATTRRTKDPNTGDWRDLTDWHDIVLWRGDRVAPYLTKGKKVFVEGRLQTRSWDDQSGNKRYRTEVICDSAFGLMLLGGPGGAAGASPGGSYRSSGSYSGGGGSGGGYNRPSPQPSAPRGSEPAGDSGGSGMQDDDDIPF